MLILQYVSIIIGKQTTEPVDRSCVDDYLEITVASKIRVMQTHVGYSCFRNESQYHERAPGEHYDMWKSNEWVEAVSSGLLRAGCDAAETS